MLAMESATAPTSSPAAPKNPSIPAPAIAATISAVAIPRAMQLYGVQTDGCGLCQSAVPCESCIPAELLVS